MVDYYVLAQLPISLNAGSIPATSTNLKLNIMKYLYEQLDELLNTIKYAEASGNEDADYLEDEYFIDVLEACREIVEYTAEEEE